MATASDRQPTSQQGFTLLEVLMVVLLVGIISSVVMLNINTGGAERHLQVESDRLATLLEQASGEAVMQNQEYGLRLTATGYVFLCLDEERQRWSGCKDEIFRARELPEGLELRVTSPGSIAEFPLPGNDKDATTSTTSRQDDEDATRITPDLFLLSSGEASATGLELRVVDNPGLRSEIRIDAVGRVRVGAEEGGNAG